MLIVELYLAPNGDVSRRRHMGTGTIANNLIASLDTDGELGDYTVTLSKWGDETAIWKKGQVVNFQRKRRGPWDLLYLALKNCVGDRNRVTEASTPNGKCRSCGAPIRWEETARGKKVPISLATGRSHFEDCPASKSWSGRSRRDAGK